MIFASLRDGRLAGSAALAKVSPTYRTPVAAIWTASILSVLFVWGSTLVSVAGTSAYTIVVSCTVIFLFLSFTVPIVLGCAGMGNTEVGQDGAVEHGQGHIHAVCRASPCCSMILIFVIGIQPPNDWALYITVGFFILTAIVWFAFERNRFSGSAARRHHRGASAAIRRRNRPSAKPATEPLSPSRGGLARHGFLYPFKVTSQNDKHWSAKEWPEISRSIS